MPRLLQLNLPGAPSAWEAAGFALDTTTSDGAGAAFHIGTVRVQCDSAHLPASWLFAGITTTDIDGIATTRSDDDDTGLMQSSIHPNGALGLYSVCLTTPDIDSTIAALQRAGFDLRRVRKPSDPASSLSKGLQMAFFKCGVPENGRDVILEVIAPPVGSSTGRPVQMPGGFAVPSSGAAIAGMVVSVPREGGLEAVRAALSSRGGGGGGAQGADAAALLSKERNAVQGKGMRIAALKHEAVGLPLPLAFITSSPRL